MIKRKFTFLALLGALPALAGLASCGGDGGEVYDFTFWYTFNKNTEAKLIELTAQFESIMAEQGESVKVGLVKQGGYPEIKEKIENGINTGNIPTLTIAYPDHVASYMQKGRERGDADMFVYKLDDFVADPEIGLGKQSYLGDDKLNPNDFFPQFFDEGKQYISEGLYSIPLMKSTEVLFYNVSLASPYVNVFPEYISLKEAGTVTSVEDYLKKINWDSFMDLCEFIGDDITNGKKIAPGTNLKYALGYDSDSNLLITRLMQEGIGYSSIDPTTKHGIVDFEASVSPANFAAVRDELVELKAAYDKKAIITKLTNSGKYTNNLFVAGETVFSVGSSGGADYQEPTGDSFIPRVIKVPAVSGNEKWITQGCTTAILKNPTLSKEQNERSARLAWQFLKFLTNPTYNVEMCFDSQGYFPVRQAALNTPAWKAMEQDTASLRYKTMSVIINDIQGRYFNNAVFAGSAELRTAAGTILAQSLAQGTSPAAIENIITMRINEIKDFIK